MKKIMTVLIATSLLLAACGSSDDETDDAATETAADEAETATTQPEPEPTTTTTEAAETTTVAPTTTVVPSTTEPPARPAGFSLYDFRYCEILVTVSADDGSEVTEVWGTPGVDPCADEAWYALDPAAIQAENEASFIEMNGPRYFIVDGSAETGDGTGGTGTAAGGEAMLQQFGDITMTLLATTDVSEESAAYAPDLVVRTTTWTFEAGTEIYELTDPDGNVFIMQSYSRIVDPELSAADLPALGDRLDLPDGWSYGSRVLDEPLQVALAPEGAYVVQDSFKNSYQRNG